MVKYSERRMIAGMIELETWQLVNIGKNGYFNRTGRELETMLKYWSNAFMTTGAALIATAFFRPEDWQAGVLVGFWLIALGALFNGLSIPSNQRGRK